MHTHRLSPRPDDEDNAGIKKMSFLQKLLHILSTADPEVVSWSPDGDSFVVHDVDR